MKHINLGGLDVAAKIAEAPIRRFCDSDEIASAVLCYGCAIRRRAK